MSNAKEPQWRERMKNPHDLHAPYRQKLDIPVYLRRWLVVHGNKHPDQVIPDILEQAMLLYFDAMRRPARFSGHEGRDYLDDLIAGRYVSGNEAELCAALLQQLDPGKVQHVYHILNKPMVVCITNGVYGYFFCVDAVTGYGLDWEQAGSKHGPFLTWMLGEWPSVKLTRRHLDGPVIHLPKGTWPIHPRLIPGHPRSRDILEF
jgi:hypothetical protein